MIPMNVSTHSIERMDCAMISCNRSWRVAPQTKLITTISGIEYQICAATLASKTMEKIIVETGNMDCADGWKDRFLKTKIWGH